LGRVSDAIDPISEIGIVLWFWWREASAREGKKKVCIFKTVLLCISSLLLEVSIAGYVVRF